MNINKLIHKKVTNNKLSNTDLVQLIEQAGEYLNLKTLAEYAKYNGMSYNGVKKFRKVITLFGCKFVIDND